MEFREFKEKTAAGLQAYLGDSMRVEFNNVRKNNGILLEGLSIVREGINISPTIYLNDFYREYCNGKSLSFIVTQLADIYKQSKMQKSMDMDFFLDYEKVKTKLIYKLVNYDKNKEWLENIPHIPYLDMALTFQCMVLQEEVGNATIQITKDHCRMWNVDERELYGQAHSNTEKYFQATIIGMEEIVKEIIAEGLSEELKQNSLTEDAIQDTKLAEQLADQMLHTFQEGQEEIQMFVLSNHTRIHGAAAMLYGHVLKEFAEEKQNNFYILPSSVHEVILVPDSGKENPGRLRAMVEEVNQTEVDDEEQLSNSIYYYDRRKDVITLVE